MKAEFKFFAIGLAYFIISTLAYAFLSYDAEQGSVEPVGTTALVFTCGLAMLIALYFYLTGRRIGMRPEDRLDGNIEEGAGELGFFSPHSVWPLYVGASAGIVTLGLVFGTWLIFLGVLALGLTVIGLVFEYYRGDHAH